MTAILEKGLFLYRYFSPLLQKQMYRLFCPRVTEVFIECGREGLISSLFQGLFYLQEGHDMHTKVYLIDLDVLKIIGFINWVDNVNWLP